MKDKLRNFSPLRETNMDIVRFAPFLISAIGCTILKVETENKRTNVHSTEDQDIRNEEIFSRLHGIDRRLEAQATPK